MGRKISAPYGADPLAEDRKVVPMLGMLERDIMVNREKPKPIDLLLIVRMAELFEGVAVDLDAPLPPVDE